MIIKVCGMRDPDNIRAVEQTNPDWMGFICWEGSKRYVAEPPAYMPGAQVKRVGVFVNPTIDDVLQRTQSFHFDLIQLHGMESPEFCRQLRSALNDSRLLHVKLIKAFGIAALDDLAQVSAYEAIADFALFDTKSPLIGGSGQPFSWDVLKSYEGRLPFLLSGGIGPDALSRLHAFSHPRWIGIDLNSRFEKTPGIKDANLLYAFSYRWRHQPDYNHISPFLP